MTRTRNRSALRLLLVVAVALLTITGAFAPVAAAQEGSPPSPPQVYQGTVTDGSGSTVADATVEVSYDGEVINSTTTDSNGEYSVDVTQQNGLDDGDTVTITVKDVSKDRTWEPAGTDQVNFQVEVQQTTDGPSDGTDDGDGTDGDTDTGDSDTGDTGGDTGGQTGGQTGGDAPAEDAVSVSQSISGTSAQVALSGGLPVTEVGFGSQTQLSAQVAVQEIASPPGTVPPGLAFVTGADITFESGGGEDVETVQMGVTQSTLDDLGVAPEQLVLAHYDDQNDEWETLETSVVSSDGDSVVLEAPSAGFSTYAVFAQEDEDVTTTTTTTQQPTTTTEAPTTTTEVPTTTTDAPPTTTPTDGSGPGPVLIGGIVVVVLAVLAALYLAFGRE